MKRTYPKIISGIIDEAMASAGLADSLTGHKASAAWIDVVGPAINRCTSRRYVEKGVLHVFLTSAPLKNELSFARQRLVEAINSAVGTQAITDVVIH